MYFRIKGAYCSSINQSEEFRDTALANDVLLLSDSQAIGHSSKKGVVAKKVLERKYSRCDPFLLSYHINLRTLHLMKPGEKMYRRPA